MIDLELTKLLTQRREIQKPIPKTADDPGRGEISKYDWNRPTGGKRLGGFALRLSVRVLLRVDSRLNRRLVLD